MPCQCGQIHTERNGSCASCNRVARKKEQKPKEGTLKKGIPKVSPKKAKREQELAKLRKVLKQQYPFCQTCGSTDGPLDYSHILSVKQFPQHELNPMNALIQCRKDHEIHEHGSIAERMNQSTWPEVVEVIRQLEPGYYSLLMLKLRRSD